MNIQYDVKLGAPTGAEPVTLQQVKDQVKQASLDDDTLITALISQARDQIEQYTGCTLVARSVTVVVMMDELRLFELPFGPVAAITNITLLRVTGGGTDTVLTTNDYLLYGSDFKSIRPNACGMFSAEYTVAWTAVPNALKLAVLHQAAFLYEHRGDEGEVGFSPTAKSLSKSYRRIPV